MDLLRTWWHALAAAAFAVPALLIRFLARMLGAWLLPAPALWMALLPLQLGDDLAPVQGGHRRAEARVARLRHRLPVRRSPCAAFARSSR